MRFKAAVGLFFLACSVFAATEAEKKAAYELMEAAGMPENINRIIDYAVNSQDQLQTFTQMGIYKAEITDFFNKHLCYNSIKSDLAEIYLRYFTADEIRQITAFYRSPVGQKMTKSAPFVMKDVMLLVQKKASDNAAELVQKLSRQLKESYLQVPGK